jgi:UrcA family protein
MKRMILAAAMAILSTPAAANNPILLSSNGGTARIGYADLDLRSGAGRTKMTSRIRLASEMLCVNEFSIYRLTDSPTRVECYRKAVASGIDQMNEIVAR